MEKYGSGISRGDGSKFLSLAELYPSPSFNGYEIAYVPKKKKKTPVSKFSKAERRKQKMLAAQPNCIYCGCEMTFTRNKEHSATIEHLTPRSRGGGKGNNISLSCLGCNNDKSDLKDCEYRIVILLRKLIRD